MATAIEVTTFDQVKNRVYSKLAAAITNSATSLTVTLADAGLFPDLYPYHLTIEDEIVRVTNRVSNTLTIVRAQQDTTAAAHANKSYVALNITAKAISDLNAAVNTIEQALESGINNIIVNGTADYLITLYGGTVNSGGADIRLHKGAKIDNTVDGTLKLMTTASGYISISEGQIIAKCDYLDLDLDVALRFTGTGKNIDGEVVFRDKVTVGRPAGGGVDFILYGAVANYRVMWDANGDTNGRWTFGDNDYGVDVAFRGATSGVSMLWDASADTLALTLAKMTQAWTTTEATAGEQGLKITVTDSVVQSAGYIQSLLIDHNITGAKSGSAQTESISVDMDIGANVVYAYPIAVYVSKTSNPNISFLAGMQIYLEDMGSGTIGAIAGIDIQIGSTNLGSRHTGIRLVTHTGTSRSGILFEKAWTVGIDFSGTGSGGVAATFATADIRFQGGATLKDDGTSLTLAGSNLVGTLGAITLAGKLTAGSSEIEGSNFDINGGTVDGITSLTVANNVDIGAYNLRAASLTADGLTAGRVVFAGTDGLLVDDSDFTFATDTLTVTKIGAFEATGAINFGSQNMTNVDIDSGTIGGVTLDGTIAGGSQVINSLGHIGIGVASDVDICINIDCTLTDTDDSGKAAIKGTLQVARTVANDFTSAGWGLYGQAILDSTNLRNFTNTDAGLRGVCGYFGTEAGSAGTVTRAASVFANATISATGATVTNLDMVHICTPTVGGSKVTNLYGLYISDMNTGSTLNYAIYTNAGLVQFGGATKITLASAVATHLEISGTAKITSGEQAMYVNFPSETAAVNGIWVTIGSTVTSGDLTGIRSRVTGNATSSGANVRGAYLEAKVGAGKYAAMLEGALIHADYSAIGAGTISGDVRGLTVHISQGTGLTAANLYGILLNIQTRGNESISTDDIGLLIRNQAAGGNGRTMDSAIKIAGLNMGGGTIPFTVDITFQNGATLYDDGTNLTLAGASLVGTLGAVTFSADNTWSVAQTGVTLTSPTINGTIATTGLTMPGFIMGGNITVGTGWDMALNRLYIHTSITANVNGMPINATDINDWYMIGKARDTDVGMVEIWRMAGAADPFFAMCGSQEFKFYYSGYATFGGYVTTTSYHEFTEMGAPGAGVANTMRMYAFEGAGDALTDACMVFQDGTIDVFAQESTEPDSPIFEFPDNTKLELVMRKPDRRTIQFVATYPDGREFVMRELRYPNPRWN